MQRFSLWALFPLLLSCQSNDDCVDENNADSNRMLEPSDFDLEFMADQDHASDLPLSWAVGIENTESQTPGKVSIGISCGELNPVPLSETHTQMDAPSFELLESLGQDVVEYFHNHLGNATLDLCPRNFRSDDPVDALSVAESNDLMDQGFPEHRIDNFDFYFDYFLKYTDSPLCSKAKVLEIIRKANDSTVTTGTWIKLFEDTDDDALVDKATYRNRGETFGEVLVKTKKRMLSNHSVLVQHIDNEVMDRSGYQKCRPKLETFKKLELDEDQKTVSAWEGSVLSAQCNGFENDEAMQEEIEQLQEHCPRDPSVVLF